MWKGNLESLMATATANVGNDLHAKLERLGQLVRVENEREADNLPPNVTHVRLPDGEVKRIRFS